MVLRHVIMYRIQLRVYHVHHAFFSRIVRPSRDRLFWSFKYLPILDANRASTLLLKRDDDPLVHATRLRDTYRTCCGYHKCVIKQAR